jgi:hypothetical protein
MVAIDTGVAILPEELVLPEVASQRLAAALNRSPSFTGNGSN